jgi:hypothetical protein
MVKRRCVDIDSRLLASLASPSQKSEIRFCSAIPPNAKVRHHHGRGPTLANMLARFALQRSQSNSTQPGRRRVWGSPPVR